MAGSNGTVNGTLVSDDGSKVKLRRPRHFAGANRAINQATAKPTTTAKTTSGKPFMMAAGTILPPPDHQLNWKYVSFDTAGLSNPARLLEHLASMSPEMSKGAWDYMRLLNPGWKVEVFNVGTDTPNTRGKKIIDDLIKTLDERHGSADVVWTRFHMGAYFRGGYFGELVMDEAQREALDIATPDPSSVRFRVQQDPETRKQWYQLGQWQVDKFVPLDEEPGVSYIPVDPFPGSPYGRPLVAPAVFCCVFLMGLLHDLRRVISQQGWPRIEIAIDTEKLLSNLEQGEEVSTAEGVERLISNAIADVQSAYAKLQPDDAYIHSDEVEIKGPIGVTNGANLSGIDSIIAVVERMLVRALKTTPLMMGITDGVSEANANRQWEILIAGVKALQHLLESMLNRFFRLACQAQGLLLDVNFEFSEIRASEAQRDALARSQEIDNAKKLYDMGLTDQDETAQELVGHEPAEEEPRYEAALKEANAAKAEQTANDTNPDKGETKAVMTWRVVEHPMRLAHCASRDAWRGQMTQDGKFWVREETRKVAILGESLPRSYWRDGEMWALALVQTDGDGFERQGVYDVFSKGEPQHEASTDHPSAGRSPVGGSPVLRHRDGQRRRSSRRLVGSRHA